MQPGLPAGTPASPQLSATAARDPRQYQYLHFRQNSSIQGDSGLSGQNSSYVSNFVIAEDGFFDFATLLIVTIPYNYYWW